ncbi:OR9I1 protein, partial [Alectura lathami]|nr:OR9I1 protein [Alectura lathami]
MNGENITGVSGFILLGFSDVPQLHTPMFITFSSLYALTVMGNLLLMLLINTDCQLHAPMYFFLSHLSFMDLCLSSAVTPKALQVFLLGRSHISLAGCFAQMYFFLMIAVSECFLLGVMAYDRYAAVCQPLLYASLMSRARCYRMTMLVYAAGFLTSLVHTVLAGRLSFCRLRSINHFFCELPTLLHLSCSRGKNNTYLDEYLSHFIYMFLQMHRQNFSETCSIWCAGRTGAGSNLELSAGSRLKTFSTCASHLAAVTIYFMPGLLNHLLHGKVSSQGEEKLVSIFYTMLTPMLNPLVYSLRNTEVKGALRRLWGRRLLS